MREPCRQPETHTTAEGLETFKCPTCGVEVCMWCEGGADSEDCDDCWVEKNPRDDEDDKYNDLPPGFGEAS